MRSNYSAKQESKSRQDKAGWLQRGKVERAIHETSLKRQKLQCHWDFEFRGNMGKPFEDALITHEELLLCGAAGTGKTLRILFFINWVMWNFPGARALIIRKVRADLAQSTLVTYERDIMGYGHPIVSSVQRTNRMSYRYPNSSEVVVGGMDRPGAVLSAEYDIIYAPEAVQFTLPDWETLVMRLRAGPYPHPLLIGDTNPDRPDHWLKQRADAELVKLLNTYHKDNPAWWDNKINDWTAKGLNYVQGKLQRLTGVRKKRYLENIWALTEGAVYDFNPEHHVISREQFNQIAISYYLCTVDFGFRAPFVWHLWAVDKDDRMYLSREIYMTERLVADHAITIKAQLGDIQPRFFVCDAEDPEGIATLVRSGLPATATTGEEKDIAAGIQTVQSRLRLDATGKPAMFFVEDALVERDMRLLEIGHPTSSRDEEGAYLWDDKAKKDKPVDEYNHGMDAKRYAARVVELRGKHRLLIYDED